MKIVVDTNIIFSGIISPNGKISDLLLNSDGIYSFIAPEFILDELDRHQSKLLHISKLKEDELEFLKKSIFSRLEFYKLEQIESIFWEKAFQLTSKVDEFDTPFVALSLKLKSKLWTGDLKLKKGLELAGFKLIIDTNQLIEGRLH
ncbi:PIN domain-containing protein [Algoriphagus taiwanensis]|uniref:PIN domain-containing protein n=1 Tax=Algoriphagus taiwanensis TaxID=1445656 RepID=A0ABQ6PV78_9BACT|nr:PIN domain-containing protein [Algoriphagus taiwanensis]